MIVLSHFDGTNVVTDKTTRKLRVLLTLPQIGKCQQSQIAEINLVSVYLNPSLLVSQIKKSQPSTLYLVFELQMFSIHVIKFDAQDYELYSLNACQW